MSKSYHSGNKQRDAERRKMERKRREERKKRVTPKPIKTEN